MDELKVRVEKAETASEEYQRQLNLLQARLDESQQAQGQLEDQMHESNKRVEGLENEKVQAARQKREIESTFESERAAMIHDQNEQKNKNEESQEIIKRLKENLAQREMRINADEEKGLQKSCRSRIMTKLKT